LFCFFPFDFLKALLPIKNLKQSAHIAAKFSRMEVFSQYEKERFLFIVPYLVSNTLRTTDSLIQMWSNNYLEGTLIPSSYLKISKESSFL
jgi:hypothetical protein